MTRVLLALDLTAMAGSQEFLSGKLRLCFTPAARTSLLLLRLNEAALRALRECQRQQVRQPQATPSLSPTSLDPRPQPETMTKRPGYGERHSRTSASPLLQVKSTRQAPRGTRRQILRTPLHLRLACVCVLPAGSASDRFPRQPRGKHGPGLCERCGVRGEQTGAQGRYGRGGSLRAVTV